MTDVAAVVRHFTFRMGAVNGFLFDTDHAKRPYRWVGATKEERDRNRRAYVNDMRWVKAAVRAVPTDQEA